MHVIIALYTPLVEIAEVISLLSFLLTVFNFHQAVDGAQELQRTLQAGKK